MKKKPEIAICVATYRRPSQLKALIAGLAALKMDAKLAESVQLVIADNDAERSAAKTAAAAANLLPWRTRYVVEPRRGIAQVRNASVREADDTAFIAFIDDDEIPEPGWLQQLIAAQERFNADVVCGPVVPSFLAGAPDWIRKGQFFNRCRYATGQPMRVASTNNVLLRSRIFHSLGGFDETFGLTGGEDNQFFLRVFRAGYRMVWCDEAVVHETIGPERTSLKWILSRAYQGGSCQARAEMTLGRPICAAAIRTSKGFVHIARALLSLPLKTVAGTIPVVRELQRIALGAGMVGGATGITFQPYRKAGHDSVNAAPEVVDQR